MLRKSSKNRLYRCTVKGHQKCVSGGFRQLLSAGPDRRRQLGDMEFSNRYAEFLRSRAKHSSICAFLQRMQGFKKRWEALKQNLSVTFADYFCIHSGAGGNMERVNLLLKQYMCPSDWLSDLWDALQRLTKTTSSHHVKGWEVLLNYVSGGPPGL